MSAEHIDLLVVVDKQQPWFDYIWQEFVRISGAEFSWMIVGALTDVEPISVSQPILEYGRTREKAWSYHIPTCLHVLSEDYLWLDNVMPVFRDSLSEQGDSDLFYNAFVRLSRLEEWNAAVKGRRIDSYASRHPRKNDTLWHIPVVNLIFERVACRIRERWPSLKFAPKKKPVFEFSHDVDYLNKTPQLRLKQSIFGLWNSLKSLQHGRLSNTIKRFCNSISFAIHSSDYWCFDYWETLEESFNTHSVFYVYSVAKGVRGNRLIDPTYRLDEETKLVEKLRTLADKGFEIGLHGSYQSAVDGDLLALEKDTLENVLRTSVEKTRQHWLRYDEGITPYIHEKLFQYDSTLGWNDVHGFRSGCASRYRPYDHINQRPFTYFETPMVVMDAQLFDYAAGVENERLVDVLNMLQGLLDINSVHVAINWHQRTSHPDYNWHFAYETIMKNVG